VAWRMGYIDDGQLAERAHALLKSGYGSYLLELLDGADEAFSNLPANTLLSCEHEASPRNIVG
jgi:hypothetical protein